MYLLEDSEGNIFSEGDLYELDMIPIILPTNPSNNYGAIIEEVDSNG